MFYLYTTPPQKTLEKGKKMVKKLTILFIVLLLFSNLPNVYESQIEKKGIMIRLLVPPQLDWKQAEAQIIAIHPEKGETQIFRGKVSGSQIYLDSTKGEFREVIQAWLRKFKGEWAKSNMGTCLIMDIWITLKNNTVITTKPCITIPYKPYEADRELVLKGVEIVPGKMQKMSRNKDQKTTIKKQDIITYTYYEWRRDDSFTHISDITKVPVMIVQNIPNSEGESGEIDWSITILSAKVSGFKLTVAYGTGIVENAPNVDLEIYSLDFTTKNIWEFSKGDNLPPGGSQHAYIYARVAHIYEKEYKVTETIDGVVISEEPTGRERIREYVFDVKTIETGDYLKIAGGKEDRLPSISGEGEESIMDWFYEGTKEEVLVIPNSNVSDGDLDVNEDVQLGEIFDNFDVYEQNFEIGIPVGALVATLAGWPTFLEILASGLVVSLSYSTKSTLFVGGDLYNDGKGDFGAAYDVPVVVYIMLSKYRYLASATEYYDVPAGVMFKCVADTSGGSSSSPGITPFSDSGR